MRIRNYILAMLVIGNLCGCGSHPKDETNIDDVVRCGFGQEYVSGYTRDDGTEVSGYCRDKN